MEAEEGITGTPRCARWGGKGGTGGTPVNDPVSKPPAEKTSSTTLESLRSRVESGRAWSSSSASSSLREGSPSYLEACSWSSGPKRPSGCARDNPLDVERRSRGGGGRRTDPACAMTRLTSSAELKTLR